MLVAVFRARDDGERTARQLLALGHEALLAPVIESVPTGDSVPDGPFQGVIFTSAHGVAALERTVADRLLALPCFCVGGRTAELASRRGFAHQHVGRADAVQLASLVCAVLPRPARLLLVAGRDRKPAIERHLGDAGHDVVVAEVYAARAVDSWPNSVTDAFRRGRVEAALHYSRRSASLALQRASEARVRSWFDALRHYALSEDAAAPIRGAGIGNVVIAAEPNERSLLALTAEGSGALPDPSAVVRAGWQP